MDAAREAALELNIQLAPYDSAVVKSGVQRRTSTMREVTAMLSCGEEASQAAEALSMLQEQTVDPPAATVQPRSEEACKPDGARGQNRTGRSGRPVKDQVQAAQQKEEQCKFKGAASHAAYSSAVQEVIETARKAVVEDGASVRGSAAQAVQLLQDRGIQLSVAHARSLTTKAVQGGAATAPEKPGGVYVTAEMENRVADLVRRMRRAKLPVFADDVLAWMTELLAGSPNAINFHDGVASPGWYQGFLRRQGFTTGTERPLGTTRAEWLTEDNLKSYYDVVAEVMVRAGVAEWNPDYDEEVPHSERVYITHPERILSFDETRVELDCTTGGKSKSDRVVRAGVEDRGEALKTKSSSTATAVCGRTGTGQALPPMIVFASGQSFSGTWAPHKVSEVLDNSGAPLPWRYFSNEKGSLNEEGATMYLKQILLPAAGNVKPKSECPGQQAVVFCDGVGTHIGFTMLEAAVNNGLEIALRVPHLSFRLQGEDTENFGPLKVTPALLRFLLPRNSTAYTQQQHGSS